ncbi:MAG: response regulator [Cyanobacteria bacterium P01_H01_bin.105]
MVTALIVEDSLTDRERLTHYLQQSGITVVGVQSSEEALLKVQSKLPDMVFLDIVLPGQSGFEFCRDLKTNKQTQSIPVVICSTKNTEADKLWGSMLGADAYLSKPVDQKQLAQAIQKVMQ